MMAATTGIWSATRAALAAALLMAAGGCSVLGGSGPAPSIYDLAAPSDFSSLKGRANVQVLVPLPSASDALASSRVAVRMNGTEIAYLPGVTWSDELPPLVQTTLVRAFENSGRIKAAGRPGESLSIDDQLIVDIRSFELDVTGSPVAHVVLGARLMDDRSGRVRATEVFDVRQPAGSDAASAAIPALNTAAAEAIRQMVAWTVDKL